MGGPMQLSPIWPCYVLYWKGRWHSLPLQSHARVPWTYAVKQLNCSYSWGLICSMLPSFPNFPFHWKCWYLNRSDFSKERKSNFEPAQILFEMKQCTSSLNNYLFSSLASSLWTSYIACDDLWHWHHHEAHYFIKGLKIECLGSVMLDKIQD